MPKREYKYLVVLEDVVVYYTMDDRPTEEMVGIIKSGLKHIFEDETLKIELFILTQSTKFNKVF